MSDKIDFAGEAEKCLGVMDLNRVDIDPGLSHIEVENGEINLDLFSADKVEKAVICTIWLHETSVMEATAMVWPDDIHNFPVLWCNLTVVPTVMNVLIFDFIPMLDIVVWPEYAEKFITSMQGLKSSAMEILGADVKDKSVDIPSQSVYALSPFKMAATVSDDGIEKVPDLIREYTENYIELWKNAEPVKEGTEKDFYLSKKAATSKLMKANDPGYHFMLDVFGEEMTGKVFDIVF